MSQFPNRAALWLNKPGARRAADGSAWRPSVQVAN